MKVKIRAFDELPRYDSIETLDRALQGDTDAGLHVFKELDKEYTVTLKPMSYKGEIAFIRQPNIRPLPAVQVAGLRGARVFARSGLLSASGEFVTDALYMQPLYLTPTTPENQAQRKGQMSVFGITVDAEGKAELPNSEAPPRLIPGKLMLFGTAGDAPYSHFVWDTLPTLWFLDQLGPDVRLLVDRSLPGYKREMIRAAGVDDARIEWRDSDETVLCEMLYVPSRISINNFVIRDEGLKVLCRLAAPGVAEGRRPEGARRIFLDRAGDRADFRILKNEDRIWEIARRHGFVRISPGRLPLAEKQIAFGAAECVIGQYGGGIQNYFLCAPGTRFLVLQSSAFVRDILEVTSQALGHRVETVLGQAETLADQNATFEVNEEVFAGALERLLAEPSYQTSLLVGPSHTGRWALHVREGVVPGPLPESRIMGFGGAPIWSTRLFEQSRGMLGDDEGMVVLVPDFRFGNSVLLADPVLNSEPMLDGFLAIDQKAMTPEHDRAMLERGIAGLKIWHQEFGSRARYIFWCLFSREVSDRAAGRHLVDGVYRHPVFNLDDIAARLPDLDIIDLSEIRSLPVHEVRRVLIDSSGHPSQIGFLMLNGIFFERLGPKVAYERAVAEIEAALIAHAGAIVAATGRKMVLTGNSVWLDTLSSYMGEHGTARLASAGVILAPLDPQGGRPTIAQLMADLTLADCSVVVFSAGGADLSAQLAEAFGTDAALWADVSVIDWEGGAEPVLRDRKVVPFFERRDAALPGLPRAIRPALQNSMVEYGLLGTPTWPGITHVLELLTRPLVESATARTYWVEGEVLVTRDKVAFLIGGNHDVLKFATGEFLPSPASLEAFAGNMASRRTLARAFGVPWLHVIFPDKQSVMCEEFPVRPLHRLGTRYLEALPEDLRGAVLYPAEALRAAGRYPSYLPLDTHMTDHGSLDVLSMMLERIGIAAADALERIGERIIKQQRWQGDLGSKLNPPLYQDGVVLMPDWPMRHFSSPGGSNDGMVDILLNPEAPRNETVLLFGDSFFRMMLPHLSAVFSRVVCLRTRFLHAEMVALIRPDVVFTGNVERYLSHVVPDAEAQAFALYPHLRGSTELALPGDFLQAWAAVTAPDSSKAEAYFKAQGLPSHSTSSTLPARTSFVRTGRKPVT